MAEALETTVLSETCKKEDIWITSPPDVHVLENNLINNDNDDDDDDKFEEMSKQQDQPKETIDIEEDCNEEFEEMTKTNREEIDIDNEDEIHFKIKEEDIDDDDLDENVVGGQVKLENLIDVETTATSAANLATSDVDLLGNDIVKSIEKANLLYDGGNQQGLGQLFKPSIVGNVTAAADNLAAGCSSEDDMEFKPVTSGRKNKKQKQKYDNNNKNKNSTGAAAATDSSCSVDLGSSFADSESSDVHMQEKSSNNTEGWSFEADDLDVNKLLSEVIPVAVQADSAAPAVIAEVQLVEEKAALEDVFKFDSELGSNTVKESKAVVLPPTELNNMSTSLNYDDSNNSDEKSNSLSQSMTYGGCSTGTTSNSESNMSESSVGNSPNPRAASKKKGKSKKKKR